MTIVVLFNYGRQQFIYSAHPSFLPVGWISARSLFGLAKALPRE